VSTNSNASSSAKTPWHLWVVGVLALLWNASGAYTIVMAQAGKLQGMRPDEVAYYAAQPAWFVVLTDIALFSAIAAALALLFRSRAAVELFLLSFLMIVITDAYDIAAGTAQALANTAAMVVTGLIAVLALLQFYYARRMYKRSLLK
jgi:hypothetical protein